MAVCSHLTSHPAYLGLESFWPCYEQRLATSVNALAQMSIAERVTPKVSHLVRWLQPQSPKRDCSKENFFHLQETDWTPRKRKIISNNRFLILSMKKHNTLVDK